MKRNFCGRGFGLRLWGSPLRKGCVGVLLIVLCTASLHAATLPLVETGKGRAIILLGDSAGPLERKAAELLQSRVEQRTGARLPIVIGSGQVSRFGKDTARVAIATPDSGLLEALGAKKRTTPSPEELGEEGFFIDTSGHDIILLAREGRGVIYAVGKLLHTAEYSSGSMLVAPPQGMHQPAMHDRFLHVTFHGHTFFEVKDVKTIAPIIEELALWGLNGLSLEIEEGVFNDPFDNSVNNADGRAVWSKAKELFRIANSLGLKLGLVDSANEAYKNQITTAITAKGGISFNDEKLVNPMLPAGRALLLRNRENLYRDLDNSGIRLDNALWFAYDTGGCTDEICKPWITTFLKLTEELAAGLQRHYPSARAYVTDWNASDDEAAMMVEYFDHHPKTRLAGVWKQDRSAIERFDRLDKGFSLFVFLDLSVGGFGTIGAQPLPTMISDYVGNGSRRGMTGLMIYTEGIYDDFNKAMATQEAWSPSTKAKAFAREYANYFFDATIAGDFARIVQQSERSWVDARIPLEAFSQLMFIDVPASAQMLEQLTLSAGTRLRPEVRSSWRWQVFDYRARIGKIAAGLHSARDFRDLFLQALDYGVPRARLRQRLKDKQDALDQYQVLVTDLRERVYQIPPDILLEPMNIEGSYMTQAIHVPAAEWREVLKELSAKVEVP